ncbi:hypothetical protein [Methylotuvimicrobium sp.]|uniref:hypothetical protein n=1 Tax=Methylotuvimicrobium sp. TaxID=2822413 RepID=UPI003D654F63
MNVLYLYNATQTYTATVFEHLASFQKYSRHRSFFVHQDQYADLNIDYSLFDVVVVHYTIRLPFNQISQKNANALSQFRGLKVLFIQDEYDHPTCTWDWIKRLGISLVFTVVPSDGVATVYPPRDFPGIRFVSVLTGFVPDDLRTHTQIPPSERSLIVGYRGRPLPVRYGELGQEKVRIAKLVKEYCLDREIPHDVAWTEEARIYGPKWYEFMSSCRAMLGSESGSNVFDWDGSLIKMIKDYKIKNHDTTDDEIYENLIKPLEIPNLMNQASPRIFEAIAARTVLVLFEGNYSGVVKPGIHFIPLKKDGSNLNEVFGLLANGDYVDAMSERAWRDVIASNKYSYRSFVNLVDTEMERSLTELRSHSDNLSRIVADTNKSDHPTPVTTCPIRAKPPQPSTDTIIHTVVGSHGLKDFFRRFAIYMWWKLPESVRLTLKPRLKRFIGRG